MRTLQLAALLSLTAAVAACASSTPSGAPDAEPVAIDADIDAEADAMPPDATPDAEPCIPDPDGETCNGLDDDCDDATDEGYPGVGDPCTVGVGTCEATGQTVCSADGSMTECDAVPGTPGDELCGTGADEDCDTAIDEGFPDLGGVCSVGTGACIASGIYVCSASGLTTQCNATPGDGSPELCNGLDDDCDGPADEGFQVGVACDGGDLDLCGEGVWACDGAGGRVCTDDTGSTYDLCGGGDDDCDPQSVDGSEDPAVGQGCDGTGDTDLCIEGVNVCSGGQLVCTDNTGSTVELCGGGNEDCDAASPDGSEDPMLNAPCDGGGDSDLCVEGVRQCTGGSLVCSDTTSSTVDLCGNGDEDCDAASADGSEDPLVGTQCDGAGDTDLCVEGVQSCSSGQLVCSDNTSSTAEVCDGSGADEDCEGGVDEDWNRNDNPACGTPLYIGSVDGDVGGGTQTVTDSWYDEEWTRVRFVENDDGVDDVEGRIQLYSPPGTDFDLYVYCNNCGGTLVGSSANHPANWATVGHTETVAIGTDDDWGSDDSFDAIIEVRHHASNLCAYWTVTVAGEVSAPNNCNQ